MYGLHSLSRAGHTVRIQAEVSSSMSPPITSVLVAVCGVSKKVQSLPRHAYLASAIRPYLQMKPGIGTKSDVRSPKMIRVMQLGGHSSSFWCPRHPWHPTTRPPSFRTCVRSPTPG